MRSKTFCIVYATKLLELVGIIVLTVFQITCGSLVLMRLREGDKFYLHLLIMIPLSFVLSIWHLFYNNLFTNWRFQIKMQHYNLGKYCMFDGLNYLFCSCALKRACRDKCCTWGTSAKWFFYVCCFGILTYLVREWKAERLQEIEDQILVDASERVAMTQKSHVDI
jgi:hypothetical protein